MKVANAIKIAIIKKKKNQFNDALIKKSKDF